MIFELIFVHIECLATPVFQLDEAKRKMTASGRYTVVMGDIVGSEASNDRARLHRTFNDAVKRVNGQYSSEIASPMTITLGDEFQGLVKSRIAAFQIIHDMRLELLVQDVKCRFVIGDVILETPLNETSAWNMLGKGLAAARQRLEEKGDPNTYRFSFLMEAGQEQLLEAVGAGLTYLEEDWTRKQRDYVIAALLKKQSVEEIAGAAGVSSRAVYKGLEAANLKLYQTQLSAIRAYLQANDFAKQ